jgi:hypothetical protein
LHGFSGSRFSGFTATTLEDGSRTFTRPDDGARLPSSTMVTIVPFNAAEVSPTSLKLTPLRDAMREVRLPRNLMKKVFHNLNLQFIPNLN